MSPRPSTSAVDPTRTVVVPTEAPRPAWLLAAVAAIDLWFLIAASGGIISVPRPVLPAPFLVSIGILLLAARRPVVGGQAPEDLVVTVAALAATALGFLIDWTVVPQGVSAWSVLLACSMVAPYVFAAIAWRRRVPGGRGDAAVDHRG